MPQLVSRPLFAFTSSTQTKSRAAALVQQGTTSNQRVYISTLKSLPDVVEVEDIKPPTLVIVGDVVKLHEKLEWFGNT